MMSCCGSCANNIVRGFPRTAELAATGAIRALLASISHSASSFCVFRKTSFPLALYCLAGTSSCGYKTIRMLRNLGGVFANSLGNSFEVFFRVCCHELPLVRAASAVLSENGPNLASTTKRLAARDARSSPLAPSFAHSTAP